MIRLFCRRRFIYHLCVRNKSNSQLTSSFFPYNLFNVCKYSKSIKNALRIFIKRLINSVICSFYNCILHSLPASRYLMSQHFYLFSHFHRKKVSDLFYYILVRHIRQVLCELRFILTFEMFDKCFH